MDEISLVQASSAQLRESPLQVSGFQLIVPLK